MNCKALSSIQRLADVKKRRISVKSMFFTKAPWERKDV